MTIKTIALGLFSAPEAEWLAPMACDLARNFGAHLTGIHPTETLLINAGTIEGVAMITPAMLDWQVEESETIRRVFEAATRGETFGSEFRAQKAGGVGSESFLLENLQSADLVVLGRTDPHKARPDILRLRERAIRDSGRPALMLPKEHGLNAPAERVLIGWSATREATRAAHDVLALTADGATIDLLRVHATRSPSEVEFDSRHDLAMALDRRGYRVNLLDRDAPAGEIGEMLLQVAQDLDASLIATGAFGHSRVYDFVIGAATRQLLSRAELPLLLSK